MSVTIICVFFDQLYLNNVWESDLGILVFSLHSYNILVMVWLYFIPLAVMSALYAIIGNQVWHKPSIK